MYCCCTFLDLGVFSYTRDRDTAVESCHVLMLNNGDMFHQSSRRVETDSRHFQFPMNTATLYNTTDAAPASSLQMYTLQDCC